MLEVSRASRLVGSVRVPGDKSLTHRAYMLGAAASGPSVVRRPLLGEDCEATLRCLAQMGLAWARDSDGTTRLSPSADWSSPAQALDCGNSGTTMRLMSGLIASRPILATLEGDASLSRRPMGRIAQPLRLMGAGVEGDHAPLTVRGTNGLCGIDYSTPVASAQIKSCILLAGLRAGGTTIVREPHHSRDHTERMLRASGVRIETEGNSVVLPGGQTPSGFEFTVPGDISSAAFWMVAAALVPGSEVLLKGVGLNPSRTGILDVLAAIGVRFEILDPREELGEPVGDVAVFGTADRKPFVLEGALIPRLVDEVPVLAVLATQCDGESVIRDAKEVRVKESDRILVMGENLRRMGADLDILEDGLVVRGPTPLTAISLDAGLDHRIAMSFAVAGLVATGTTQISGDESIGTSYPDFVEHLRVLCQN